MSANTNDSERAALPQAERLRQACAFASRNFGNEILRGELKEAADYFASLAQEDNAEPQLSWTQIDARKFAVQSNALQMTEAGLRMAMYQIPKRLRKDLLKFRWVRRYRADDGKTWLEFEAV